MSNSFDTREMEHRARGASYLDGLTELFAAAVLAVIAVMWIVTPALVGVVSAFIVLYGWKVVERVKERVTYPRLGYFRERPEDPQTTARGMLTFIGLAVLLMIVAIAVFGDIGDASEWRRAAPLLSGLALSGGFWYMGDRSGLLRHRLVAGFSIVTGVLLWAFSGGKNYEPVVWHLLGLACLLGALGSWSLLHFLRSHPAQNLSTNA